MTCTFFGHKNCYGLDEKTLENAVIRLIEEGVDHFLVGNQGEFDRVVCRLLKDLKKQYSHIQYSVVLAYLPIKKQEYDDFSDTVFPEEVAIGPAKFAIERRNNWMIERSDYCLCYIDHTYGGAYKFAKKATRRKLTVINLGSANL